MYHQSRSKRSFSHSGNRRFHQSSFNRGQGQRNRNQRKIENLIADPSRFIKKANPTATEAQKIVHTSFEEYDLISVLKQNIVAHGFTKPTPIQDQGINPILEGKDVIGLASTGTGKTGAFLIPLIQKMYTKRDERTLIIVPTRELAIQIDEELRDLSRGMKIYSTLTIGGASMNRQIHELRRSPQVVIATPGRLKDLVRKKNIYLEDYTNIVLDEVDLMVDIGFIADVRFFISLLPKIRQSLFFSATISPKVKTILESFVSNPVTISVKKQETSENVDQDIIRVMHPSKKIDQLHDLLIQEGFSKVLIFGRTKHGVDKLYNELTVRGFKAGAIHGNKSQGQRQRILESFKKEEIQILLATDVASRGIDIDNVTHVINYDLPESYDDYVHRIGRTGRAGNKGTALTFIG